ncbi:helicase-exonuclease AddAB subunit AddA [Staphylococcus simulans]|uniref:helicase-exonuclease AddAB subunit AddA n=1 Tax=Staphylococcus simulans TaxID=1286 RepID=UPI001E4F0674|nr:helicase-exonuclease AddAB subunit AddA [Staphylococcus simulans]MCD8914344.1 helicase-exonuclease AddAB subunit AddA [Staphylococcus simulans]
MIPKKPEGVMWTDGQWKSIYASGQDTLVAAAAGSGKTAVLVERIIQRILRDKIDVDRLLVVTFTNASAREMKHRVEKRITEASLEDPNNAHLKNQRVKIHQAQISTLHSFCLKLIQQHYDVLDIDPNFRTSSEAENILLLEQTIDEVLEDYYASLDPAFIDLTEHLSSDRSDDAFRSIIKSMYYFSVANPNPMQWLAALAQPYEDEAVQEEYLQLLTELAGVFMQTALENINKSYDLYSELALVDKQLAVVEGERAFMQRAMEGGLLNTEVIRNHQFEKRFLSAVKKIKEANEGYEADLESAKGYYDDYKAAVQKVQQEYFSRSAEDLKTDMQRLAPRVKVLANITQDVINKFGEKKRSRNILDFSDYEHFALKILMDETGHPTELAQHYRDRFDEILVDEYQDTNRVQEQILSCIKRGDETNGNLFMVGDVKQSIYKFRQADPSLFIEKYNRFLADGSTGMRIDLSQNFRSRPEVLSTTNYIFKHMMDESVGEIVYDEAAQLYFGAPFDEQPHPLHLNVLVEDEASELTGTQQEAEYIANQVETILNHHEVYDTKTKTYRKPTYKDIVILERAYSHARELQQAFKDRDIPFHVNSKEGYFEQTEVRLVLSFLRTVDNPLQDIYLVGLMRSVIYQFTEDELAHIRILSPNDDYFYQSIQHYIQHESADAKLVEKLQDFLKDLAFYQDFSLKHPVYQLIDRFYNDRFVIQYFSGLIGGKGRRANLYGLFNKAVEFEKSSFRGLFQFIRFIDELIERKQDFGEENIVGPNDDVVRMMTIHASKGLEFPFVIYSGLTTKFNKQDLSKSVILNQKYGAGLNYFDTEKDIVYPSLASTALKAINENELISEEMRLMYVALTRAKEQLFLIGRVKDEKALEKLEKAPISNNMLQMSYRLSAPNPFNLIYPILSKYQSSSITNDLKFENNIETVEASIRPSVETHIDYYDDIKADIADNTEEDYRTVADIQNHQTEQPKLQQQIETQLAFEYPYQKDMVKPTKQSVSELKRQLETEESGTSYERVRQYRLGASTYERPQFLRQHQKRKANEIGTLMHTVMQHLPFKTERLTEAELDAYIDGLVQQNIIEDDAKADIRVSEVMGFINSNLYLKIAQSDQVMREVPFVVNQSEVDQNMGPNEGVSIIQGMIDLIYREGDQYYFVDYKTDAFHQRLGVSDEEMGQQLKDRYKVQMHYYRAALETILNTKVKGYLYFFKFGTLSLDDSNH